MHRQPLWHPTRMFEANVLSASVIENQTDSDRGISLAIFNAEGKIAALVQRFMHNFG